MKNLDKKNCEKAIDELMDLLQSNHNKEDYQDFLAKNEECKASIDIQYKLWLDLSEIEVPEPSKSMDAIFYKRLNEFQSKNTVKQDNTGVKLIQLFNRNKKYIFQLGIAASLFLAGMILGPKFYGGPSTSPEGSSAETSITTTMVNYSEGASSINRMDKLTEIKEMSVLNDRIIEALNQALLKDPNINVRLSAIEAMFHFADNPKVRQNLIKAIPFQDSPIVQLTLAEVMIELQEKGSSEEWKKLLESKDLEPDVKYQLEETLKVII